MKITVDKPETFNIDCTDMTTYIVNNDPIDITIDEENINNVVTIKIDKSDFNDIDFNDLVLGLGEYNSYIASHSYSKNKKQIYLQLVFKKNTEKYTILKLLNVIKMKYMINRVDFFKKHPKYNHIESFYRKFINSSLSKTSPPKICGVEVFQKEVCYG